MANATETYNKLYAETQKQLHETGKIDPGLRREKREAGIAMREEQRAARRGEKLAAQEAYIRGFNEKDQAEVRARVSGKTTKK